MLTFGLAYSKFCVQFCQFYGFSKSTQLCKNENDCIETWESDLPLPTLFHQFCSSSAN